MPASPGLLSRAEAVRLVSLVLRRQAQLDEVFDESASRGPLSRATAQDRSLCYAITATVLRRKGEIDHLLSKLLSKPLPRSSGLAREILLATAAQLVFMRTAPHAAVALAVVIAKADFQARHFAALVNAVGRRLADFGKIGAPDDPTINTPSWLFARWLARYGPETAREIARAHLEDAPLDLTVLGDPEAWAQRLGGEPASAQTVRLSDWHGSITDLPGFAEGQWWVQDEAAAIPARLLGDAKGLRVLDLCAAPGGKTAQLATAGAMVTAVDRSARKMQRLEENLRRLHLSAETVVADVLHFQPAASFDAVLLDAPCSATGIIRRHPDIPYLRKPDQIAELAILQNKLLFKAASLVRPGGTLIYCTCSLEGEEGEEHLSKLPVNLALMPLTAGEFALPPEWLDAYGCVRTLPNQGVDGFFAMRLHRTR
ncbi:MAG: RsmB/NOP family class I SAM-dependent RNA methyltransferase [Aestuariivirgaceae bacterium]